MPIRATMRHDYASRFRGLDTYVNFKLPDVVGDIIQFGDDRMTEMVPKDKGTLASAVMHEGPFTSGRQVTGRVFVDPDIAPHGQMVDLGTGVDGPFNRPVSPLRPPPHVMRFEKRGEGPKYRRRVKFIPSSKIERGKDFSGRTFQAMKTFTRGRLFTLKQELRSYMYNRRNF